MKKVISFILIAATLFVFASCGTNEDADEGSVFPTTSAKPAESEVIFEKNITITQGRDAVLRFCGEGGEVSKIEVEVNGEMSDNLSVLAASETVIGREEGAKSDDAEFRFFIKDMNYDGYQDFGIQAWVKDVGTVPYYCWFWDPLSAGFAFGTELEDPVFDPDNSKIYCNVNDAGSEYLTICNVVDGKVILNNSISLSAKPTFATDLSSYEQFMNPVDRDAYLILVNSENTLDENYIPDDLVDVSNTRQDGRAMQQMRYCAAEALYALFSELSAAGYDDVSVTSAYRSYAYQDELFNSYINQEMAANGYTEEEATAVVKTYSAYPGTSEHQTGLCCDMHNLGAADQAFANQDAYRWLNENAWKFGFILRFPEDKEEITKITFEPWHYRFVGRYHAAKIHAMGLCLEEYIELINR